MASKLPPSMHGFPLLTCSDADLFQIIDSAIVVAALRCPQELNIRRDSVAQRLNALVEENKNEITDHHGNSGTLCLSSKLVLDDKVVKKNEPVVVNGSEKKKMIKIKIKIPQNLGQESSTGARKEVIASKIPQNLGQESRTGSRKDGKASKIPQNLGQESGTGARKDVKASKIPQNLGQQTRTCARKDVKASKIPQKCRQGSGSGARKDVADQETLRKSEGDANKKGAAPRDLNGAKMSTQPPVCVCKKREDDGLLQQKLEACERKLQRGYQQIQDAKNKKRVRLIDIRDAPKPPVDAKRLKRF